MNIDYIAGFFDADGYICLSKTRNENPTLLCGITNTVRSILEEMSVFIKSELKINCCINTKKTKKKNHSICYELRIKGPNVIIFLNQLPIKHPKKVKRLLIAREIMRNTPRNGKYTEDILEKRNLLCMKFLDTK